MTVGYVALFSSFKNFREPCCFISADSGGITWLRDQFRRLESGTLNAELIIGGEMPITSINSTLRIIRASAGGSCKFDVDENGIATWTATRHRIEEAADKLDGMLEFGRPSHNYVRLDDANISAVKQIVFSHGEYSSNVLYQMASEWSKDELSR